MFVTRHPTVYRQHSGIRQEKTEFRTSKIEFLGAFAKLRKPYISLVMSVYPSNRIFMKVDT
jgi:hypothetical protein